jgi:hypothetical protein
MGNAKVYTAKVVSSVMPCLRLKSTPQPPYSPDICPSDFFLFGWLKGKLQLKQFPDVDQLFEGIDEIFSSLSADMIKGVFRNWIHRLVKGIASDSDYVQ